MSEYDPRCVNCFHRSHENKECPYCLSPNVCKDYVRADLFIARLLARFEQAHLQAHNQTMMALSTIFDLLQEAYPEASSRLKQALETRQKAAEAETELQRTKALAEADEALKAAKEAEDRRGMAEIAESYQGSGLDNVIRFPNKTEHLEDKDAPEHA